MADDVVFQAGGGATVPPGTIVETEDRGGGVQRQVMKAVIDQSVPGMTNGVVKVAIDSMGGICLPDRYAQSLTYNGDGTVNTISFTDGTHTWTQTFTYTNGKVTGISAWVKS